MTSTKAAVLVLGWIGMVIGTMVFGIVSTFFLGVTIGSLLTAGTLGLAIKWSIEGLLSGTTSNIKQINDAMSDRNTMLSEYDE